MKGRLYVVLALIFPAFLFSETGNLPYFTQHYLKWGAGSKINYFYFSPSNSPGEYQKTGIKIFGFYSPLTEAVFEAGWSASFTRRSYPSVEWLSATGDLDLNTFYKIKLRQNLSLWLNAGLYLFAPVKDQSTYGDTSSYLFNLILNYISGRLTFTGNFGYFYDRRINFIDREPDLFERMAWEEVDYTWSPFSIGAIYNLSRFSPFILFEGEKLYGSGVPLFISTGVNLEITPCITVTPVAEWKLYRKSIEGYPEKGNVTLELTIFYHPPQISSSKKKIQISLKKRAELTISVKNVKGKAEVKLNGVTPDIKQDNTFKYLDLLPGKYSLTISAEGYRSLTTEVTLQPDEKKVLEVELRKIILPGSILGFVTTSGIPVENAKVKISGPVTSTTYTDRNGMFKIKGLPPATYSITVTAPDYQASQQFVEVESGTQEVVRINLKEIEFPHAIITLKIVTEKREPVKEYKFNVKASKFRVLKHEPGELKLKVSPGEISISISAPGRKEKHLKFSVEDGDEIETTVKLKKVR